MSNLPVSFHLHCHLLRPEPLHVLLGFLLVSLLHSCPPTILSPCFYAWRLLPLLFSLPSMSLTCFFPWLAPSHFADLSQVGGSSDFLIYSPSLSTHLPSPFNPFFLLFTSWHLSNLLQCCFLFASMLVDVPPIKISAPWGRRPGWLSSLPYLGLAAQLIIHGVKRMTLSFGLFIQPTISLPTMELDIGNQEE